LIFYRTGRVRKREELLLEESLFGWIANWSLTVPLRILTSLNEFHHLLAKYGERKSERWTFDLSKMLKGKILFQDSKTQWLIQLADFAANTWAQTIGDYEGKNGFRELFLDPRTVQKRRASRRDTTGSPVYLLASSNRALGGRLVLLRAHYPA
jgi:hypothetical protein